MNPFLKQHKLHIVILFLFGIFALISCLFHDAAGIIIINNFWMFIAELFCFIPFMFIIIGIMDVWIPRNSIEKHIGKESGIMGMVWVIFLAMLQVGPLYGAFPVTYLLWKKGGSIRNIFIYLGAFSTLKIPMLTFEIGFLGLKFTLLRTLITLPLFILIGFIMEAYLKDRHFAVKQPE